MQSRRYNWISHFIFLFPSPTKFDVHKVGAMMCEVIMKQVDELAVENLSLVRKLVREKERATKHMYGPL